MRLGDVSSISSEQDIQEATHTLYSFVNEKQIKFEKD